MFWIGVRLWEVVAHGGSSVFQKCPKKPIDIEFNIGSESIEIVQEYAYLSTRLTPAGIFTLALEH